MRHVQRVVDRVGVVQIDSVNVLARSQYLPFFSRIGPYDTALLDRARDRAPAAARRVLGARGEPHPTRDVAAARAADARGGRHAWGSMRRVLAERPDFVDAVQAEVERRGPMTSREVERALAHDRPATERALGLELVGGQAGARVPLLGRADQLGGAHDRVRAAVCRARGSRRLLTCVRPGLTGRVPSRTRSGTSSSSGSRPGPTGSAPSGASPTTSGSPGPWPDRRSRRSSPRASCPRHGAGVAAGVAARRGSRAAPGGRAGPAQPLRLARLAA